MAEIEVEFDVECDACGAELSTHVMLSALSRTLKVSPCDACMNEAGVEAVNEYKRDN